MRKVTLALLRHAKVPSHEGDMPITPDSNADIEAAVPRLRALAKEGDTFLFLGTRTHRSRQTAEALRVAIDPSSPEVKPAWGLRNPDIYLAGSRVEMGSKPEFFASQCDFTDMSPETVLEQSFYSGFLNAPDRIEFWVHHTSPPGEDAAAVARRVLHFAESFRAIDGDGDMVVAAVTHSPVMRAVLTQGLKIVDPGEPGWVEEIVIEVTQDAMTYRFRDHTGTL
ncbi:MAG: phosphoglycerate mutase family protein [Pseudomonadota bacterium]